MSPQHQPLDAAVPRRSRRAIVLGCLAAASGLLLALPAAGQAAMMTFGSSLSAPATIEDATGLNYMGNGNVSHVGADTAIWNVSLANGTAAAPAEGQIVSVKLEGCAEPAPNGPVPLTQFHFQALTPTSGGSVTVDVTTQPFAIPICGTDGASNATITTYAPTNFCVHQGDYVDFNDEGGFDPNYYPNGVPYEVLGSVGGSTADSFIRNNGTNNGDTLSSNDTTPTDGFATNSGSELMLQAVVATGPDATPLCPGGTRGSSGSGGGGGGGGSGSGGSGGGGSGSGGGGSGGSGPSKAIFLVNQRDGVNREHDTAVAIYCALSAPCSGMLTLTGKTGATLVSKTFTIPGNKTTHLTLHLTNATFKAIGANNKSLPTTLTVTPTGQPPVSAKVTLYY